MYKRQQLVQPSDLTAIEQRIFSHEQLRARHTVSYTHLTGTLQAQNIEYVPYGGAGERFLT